MAKDKGKKAQAQDTMEEVMEEVTAEEVTDSVVTGQVEIEPSCDTMQDKLDQEQDKYLRLAAEYDNFRRRTQKEKDQIYTDIKAETVERFLSVYDNLERALAAECADEAYHKGVEMTMNGLLGVFEKLGVEIYGTVGEEFDPTRHNAVMHCEDEELGENVLAEVFQKGVRIGEKVVRFAMVRAAN